MLSILIATYNSHPTLMETLESIDTRHSCEVIISDDASTKLAMHDLLGSLARGGSSPKLHHPIRVLMTDRNSGGPCLPLRRAAEIARGRYIMQLDADDILMPGALDRLIDFLEGRPDLDLTWADVQCFGSASHRKAMVPALDAWHIMNLNGLPCCALMRRSAYEAAGGWIVGEPGYHDWGMWISLALAGSRGEHAGGMMLNYRVSPTSLFHANHDKHGINQAATLAAFGGLRKERARSWMRSKAPLRGCAKTTFPVTFLESTL